MISDNVNCGGGTMFGKRSDGVKVKDIDIIEKAGPYFMPQRIDACNLFTEPLNVEKIDEWVKNEREKSGTYYSYTEILIAACVRMLYERPKTNRFVNDCVIYQRKRIEISMTIKSRLTDDGEEITIKMPFTGRESLPEIKKIFDDEVEKSIKAGGENHETTKTAGFLCKLPNWLFKTAMCLVRFLDKHNCLPKSLIHASPFHTSLYVTDLRSIKLDKIYHHLYNFGNTSIFCSLGKAMYVPVADKTGEIYTQKRMNLGLTLDERICDGLYYGKSVAVLTKYIHNPELMMTRLPEPELTGKELKKKLKSDKKAEKKLKKSNKKKEK